MVHGPDNERETGNDGNDDSGNVVRGRLLRRRGHHGGRRCAMSCEHDVHNPAASRACTCAHAVYRAHAVKSDDSQTISQTRVLNEPILARPRARARGTRLLEQFKAWRIKTFGGDFDPVASAVDEAVGKISTRQPETDRRIWLKIANRIGADAFRDLMRFQLGRTSECQGGRKPKPLRNPSSAFQSLLNAYDEDIRNARPEGGAE